MKNKTYSVTIGEDVFDETCDSIYVSGLTKEEVDVLINIMLARGMQIAIMPT